MQKNTALALLGGLTPEQFMKRHWQKKPLLIRQALPDMKPLIERSQLLEMVESEEVESRLIVRKGAKWTLKKGPMGRKSLPSLKTPDWTVLIQGVDLHNDAVHSLLQQFRFVPDARLDDLMISFASEGGGVGPHFDSYDVFLLQAHGQRKWRIGRQKKYELQEGVPLKILKDFKPEAEFVLNPGDMLYLPPGYAHDGVAVGECMTYSVGFRVPRSAELASELLMGLSEEVTEDQGTASDLLYQDPHQTAAIQDASVPKALQEFAVQSVAKALKDPQILNCLLGESLTEPKPNVWFDAPEFDELPRFEWPAQIRLDRRTKMLFDAKHIFINGESFRAAGKDAKLLRKLANEKTLSKALASQLSDNAAELMQAWWKEGWWHCEASSAPSA
ncbi:cupin domain-containing protein [Limnohabitans sp. 103DPR2]|uniref:cupin domain-containing protein n=1 Tax=Limnohabitans sp. 103DPR2 TaxID=1678129 RepID=UPI0006DCC0C0|nr:cupin domain-containing protein [Limnohabitans sp. 103DPR2]ALK91827.1 50S ribosomal protein L16 arginine hydroxylase [Limnohabitans sp. 103DPR2]